MNRIPTSTAVPAAPSQPEHKYPKVLFVCHSATLTGAPLVLYHLVSWLKQERLCDFEVLVRDQGPMVQKFEALGPTSILPSKPVSRDPRSGAWLRRLLPLGKATQPSPRDSMLLRLSAEKFDLIYSNTITNGDLVDWLAPLACPVITHVHELEHWIKASGAENLIQVMRHTWHYIAVSRAVRDHLVSAHGLSPDTITVVHEFIPVAAMKTITIKRDEIRNKLGLSDSAVIVVGSGHETWRKGKDLFVELCQQVTSRQPELPVFFLWVGGWESENHRRDIEQQVQKSGLEERVRFIGQVTNPLDYFAASDIFALVSREDPYPLVCLESALVGLPIICFEGAGGMPEFVQQDAGIIVHHLDVSAMAEKTIMLAEQPALRMRLGKQASEKVTRQHDIYIACPVILQIIRECIDFSSKSMR